MNHQFAIVSPAVAGEVQRLSCCGQFVAERLSYLYALHVGGNGDEVSAGVPAVGDHGSIDVESWTLPGGDRGLTDMVVSHTVGHRRTVVLIAH